MKVHGTRVGSDGTGYYRGSDGKYYYGNPQNGYLTETIESQKKSTPVAASSVDGNTCKKKIKFQNGKTFRKLTLSYKCSSKMQMHFQ